MSSMRLSAGKADAPQIVLVTAFDGTQIFTTLIADHTGSARWEEQGQATGPIDADFSSRMIETPH